MSQNKPTFVSFAVIVLIIIYICVLSALNFKCVPAFSDVVPNLVVADLSSVEYLEDEFIFLLEEQYVTIASSAKENASKAPSIVTVITEEEINNIGARTLNDILRIVPGFDMNKGGSFGVERYGVRGERLATIKTKVFLDGHALNMPFNGNAAFYFDDLPLKNVKRIEIMRGPGSALYGANAFLAAINIITKKADDIDGVEVSSGFGSFDTQDYNILYGKRIHDVDVTGFVNLYNSNGMSYQIKEDALSGQPFFLSRYSIAPGDTDDGRKKMELSMKLGYKDIEFKGKYMNKDTEPFVSSSYVLTDDGGQNYNYATGELSYKFDIGKKLSVKPRVYYDQYDMLMSIETLPDGIVLPPDIDGDGNNKVFPDGKQAFSTLTNRRLGGETQMEYELFDNNKFTLGFSYEWERQDNVQSYANSDPFTGMPLDSVKRSEKEWIREALRQIWAVYIQDKWDITENLGLTFGVRHDHYSDFEGTTNPRLGLAWEFVDNATLKLLYGQAFRAPTFGELYLINNSSFIGNPDLQPEKMRSYEVSLGYGFANDISVNVNYFFNVLRDRIRLLPKENPDDPFVFGNLGSSNNQGIEFEARKDFGNGNYAYANYTYLDAEGEGDALPDVPKHKGNIGFNVGLTKYINANIHAFISDERVRVETDERDANPGYALLNLTLIAKEFFNDMKVKASLSNLLDKDYSDPALQNTIPHDLPRPGRTFFIELEYKF